MQAIENLMKRNGSFDYILLETSGVADPGPIANMFWMDDGLLASIYLDGIVTVLDAGNIVKSLDDIADAEHEHHGYVAHEPMSTALVQIAYADILILNKTDTVTPAQLEQAKKRVAGINSAAPLFETTYSKIPWNKLFDLKAYDAQFQFDEKNFQSHGWHDSRISTIAFSFGKITGDQLSWFDTWIQKILWENKIDGTSEVEVHRLKGRFIVQETNDGPVQAKILQGVRETYEIVDMRDAPEPELLAAALPSKLVFIGKFLQKDVIKASFAKALDLAPGSIE